MALKKYKLPETEIEFDKEGPSLLESFPAINKKVMLDITEYMINNAGTHSLVEALLRDKRTDILIWLSLKGALRIYGQINTRIEQESRNKWK